MVYNLNVRILTANKNFNLSHADIIILIILVIWELVWKIIALWKSARNNQMSWFLVMAIINTAGILEIIYILFFQKKKT